VNESVIIANSQSKLQEQFQMTCFLWKLHAV